MTEQEVIKKVEVYDTGAPELTFSYGPQHAGTGHFRMIVTIQGDTVVEAQPDPGFVHRGDEKMSEQKTWITNIPHLERPVILDSSGIQYPYVLAVEKLMGVTPPERGQYLRVIMKELDRIASHMYWFALFGVFVGHTTMFMWSFGDREFFVDLIQLIGGARITHAYFVPGGVRNDAPKKVPLGLVKEFRKYNKTMTGRDIPENEIGDSFKKYVTAVCDFFKQRLRDYYYPMFFNSELTKQRTRNVGILTQQDAIDLGVVGTTLRGSGLRRDTRIDDPYDVYPKLKFDIPTGTVGDTYDRVIVGYRELHESCNIIKQAVEQMPDGPVKNKQHPINIKVPKGEAQARAEAARGENLTYIISDGSDTPYRVRISVPSFRNMIAIPFLLKGAHVADIPPIYFGLNYWPVEADR